MTKKEIKYILKALNYYLTDLNVFYLKYKQKKDLNEYKIILKIIKKLKRGGK
ncbi:MAG: hypothetical protein N2114_00895 [Candidatus Goldbacteria bacterium]|nr:hypothetical protein [Candidatus Goldiibacteriota bacterium]